MTEQEWLASDDPRVMLRQARFRSHKRKSRLFAVACCRCIWHLLLDERSRQAVDVAEQHADGEATDEELRIASQAAHKAHHEMFDSVGKMGACIEWAAAYAAAPNPCHGAKNASWMAATPRAFEVRRSRPNDWDEIQLFPCTVTRRTGLFSLVQGKWNVVTLAEALPTGAEKAIQAALIRCIFGNPFRQQVTFSSSMLAWNDSTVPKLAQSIYDERAFDRLHILADALEEAGFADKDILDHCREDGPHTRGCWVVDLILGKE